MKKIFWSLLAFATLTLACSKDAPKTKTDWSDYDSSRYLVSFTGTLEQTKVSVDLSSGAVAWEENDQVLVYVPGNGQTGLYKYNADGKFYPADESNLVELSDGGTAYMYYPSDAFSINGSDAVFKMPAAVSGAEDLGDKNPMAATYVQGTDEKAGFKNICALFRVQLTGKRTVSSVSLSNDDIAIAAESEYTVAWTDGIPAVSTTAADKTMTISGEYPLDETTPTEFCFLLPTTATSMSNMAVTVNLTTADAGGKTSVELAREGAMAINRSQMTKIAFYAGLFSGGSGTAEDPYKIANKRDFKNIANYAKDGYGSLTTDHFLAADYIQTADIDLGGATISRIGKYISSSDFSAAFNGVYDGGEKKLSHFTVKDDGQGAGIFSATENATLKNMVVEDINVQAAKSYTGGIVGLAKGSTFENCSLSGKVQCNAGATGGIVGYVLQGGTFRGCSVHDLTLGCIDTSSGNNYGGIVGYIPDNGTVLIEDCHNLSGALDSGKNFQVGGILGGNAHKASTAGSVTIKGCTNAASIKGAGKVGGINGYSVFVTIQDCTNEGSVTLSSSNSTNNDRYAGGICSFITDGSIESCVNKGTVKSNKTFCGGIIGNTTGMVSVTQCINEGTVNGSNSNTGGIVGYLQGVSVVSLCANKCDYVQGSARVGGLVGHINNNNAWIINSISAAKVIATASVSDLADGKNGCVGGLVGTMTAGHLANCVHGDNYVINRKGTTADNQGLVCLGGVVGHTLGDNALVQNCYTVRACDKMGVYASGEELTFASGDAGSTHMGQVYGYIEKGAVKDCYAINDATAGCSFGTSAATVSNVTVMGGGEAQGYMNNTYNTVATFADGTTGTTITLSNGSTSFDITTTYPVAILNGGAALISGYSGSEALTWEEVPALGNYPLPSALVALGAEYYQ